MRKKILSALLLGLFTVASTSTFVSCKDYDDDVKNLQEQITTNDTNLKKLVEDKIALVNAEIEKTNKAISDAEKAYKAADEELQKKIDAANKAITDGDKATLDAAKKAVEDAMVTVSTTYATKAELEKAQQDLTAAYEKADKVLNDKIDAKVEELVLVDKALDDAVKKAQKRADDAYTFAESISNDLKANYATKKELSDAVANLKETIGGVKTELTELINANTNKITALDTRLGTAEGKITAAEGRITANESAISKLDSLTKVHTADLAKLNSRLPQVADSLKVLYGKVADLKTSLNTVADTLSKNYRAAVEAAVAQLRNDVKDSLNPIRIDINNLGTRVTTEVGRLDGNIEKANDSIDVVAANLKAVDNRVVAIESRLAVISGDLSNLITSIIYNGQTSKAIRYGVVTDEKVVFPYEGKENAATFKKDDVIMSSEGGYIYSTINPAQIDFTGSSVKVVNSRNEESTLVSLGVAEVVTKDDPILTITRATQNLGNGLYKLPINVKTPANVKAFTGNTAFYQNADQTSCIAYALQTEYKAGDSTRTVTSHYDLAFKPVTVDAIQAIDAVTEGTTKPGQDITGVSAYTMKFDVADTASLEGTMKLARIDYNDVYASYVEVDTAYEHAKDVKLSVNKIMYGKDIAKEVQISVPESLINESIPVKWYVLNYNGTVVSTTEKVVFTRSIFGTINVEVSDTLSQSDAKTLNITDAVIAKLKEVKGVDAAKLFAKHAVLPLDSAKDGVLRVHVEKVVDSIKNTFKYVPSALKFENDKCVLTQPMEFVDANGLKVATINYTLTVILPETYDALKMRIGSAFNVIDKGEKYSEDYTVAWANNVNPDTKKVNYLWDTHSFNIERFTILAAAKGDATSYIDYKAPDAAQYNDFQKRTAAATDSVKVQNIRVYASNDVPASNTNAGAAPVGDNEKVRFHINQNIHFFGLANAYKTHDTFWYSVVSPINYGIFRGGKKEVEATCNNVGYCEAPLTDFEWEDFSNNKQTFKINDSRIESVTCKLIADASNNYALVKDKTITVNPDQNRLEFTILDGAATSECTLTVEIHILDIWGIETVIKGEINVKTSEAQAKKH
ncbi:MAG: hypothetical protein PUF36_05945 [Prevotella sp.]|nr:hypothetical protein [Prevotella sp.]